MTEIVRGEYVTKQKGVSPFFRRGRSELRPKGGSPRAPLFRQPQLPKERVVAVIAAQGLEARLDAHSDNRWLAIGDSDGFWL